MLGDEINNEIKTASEYAKKIRRHLHENPELSFKEYDTTAYIKKELTDMGVELMPLDVETGAVGIIRGTKMGENKVTAIRADIDALPVSEMTGFSYASKNAGVMHACGHDGHTAVLLGTARVLNELRHMFSGVVKLVFQPAEEGLYGAKLMVESGALDNPRADSIIALHCWPAFRTGDIGAWPGQYMASADMFQVKMKGRSGHGCRPYKAVNPIVAASVAVTALQNIVSSEIVTSQQAVISVCTVNAGTAFNIIPEEAVFSGTVRCLDEGVRQDINRRIERIIKGVAEAFACTYEYNYTFGVPSLVNDREITAQIVMAAEAAIGPEHVKELDGPVMGAEDFSNLVNYVGKGSFFRLGMTDEGSEELILHNDRFDFNDSAISTGISVFVSYVLNVNK